MIFSAGSMIARASSGSRSCSSSVEPLMSANSAVTVLRSPSSSSDEPLSAAPRTLGADPGGDEAAAAPTPFVNGVPHLPQKSEVGGFSALHFAHCFASAVPHFAQKLLVGELFVPHFAQRIATTFPRADAQVSRQDAPIDRGEPEQAARPAERADRDRGRAPTRLRPIPTSAQIGCHLLR